MANITPVDASAAASSLVTYAAASGGGDTVLTGGKPGVVLKVRNASGSSITVTLTGVIPCSLGSTHNLVVTAAVGDTEIPIPAYCVNATTGNAAVGYSAVTSVTVAATDYPY